MFTIMCFDIYRLFGDIQTVCRYTDCLGSFRNVKHFFKKVLGLKDNKYCSEMCDIYICV